MLHLYRFCIALLFYGFLPFLLIAVFVTGRHRKGLLERFGFYTALPKAKGSGSTYWLHAASVGEVNAAQSIIAEIRRRDNNAAIVVTTMTLRGRDVARSKLGDAVFCCLAPLDVPLVVEHAVRRIQPHTYICIETELWPVLLQALHARGVESYLLNGRISTRSHENYKRLRPLMKRVLSIFTCIAAITEADRSRFISLGADPGKVKTAGNVKYDIDLPPESESLRERYEKIVDSENGSVFVAGSTHGGEEEMLLDLFHTYLYRENIITLIAPRHIERIAEIEKLLKKQGVPYQLFSLLRNGSEHRTEMVVVIDTMGELARLYSVADYIFCGGSLVPRGGHNIMEGALWGVPVFYGPHIEDFIDAAEMLEAAGAGLRVKNVAEIRQRIELYRNDRDEYRRVCRSAREVARSMYGCSRRQAQYLFDRCAAE